MWHKMASGSVWYKQTKGMHWGVSSSQSSGKKLAWQWRGIALTCLTSACMQGAFIECVQHFQTPGFTRHAMILPAPAKWIMVWRWMHQLLVINCTTRQEALPKQRCLNVRQLHCYCHSDSKKHFLCSVPAAKKKKKNSAETDIISDSSEVSKCSLPAAPQQIKWIITGSAAAYVRACMSARLFSRQLLLQWEKGSQYHQWHERIWSLTAAKWRSAWKLLFLWHTVCVYACFWHPWHTRML